MRYAVFAVILICVGVFVWPLILSSGRRLAKQFSETWNEADKDEPTELDNEQPPISTQSSDGSSTTSSDSEE